MTSPPIPLAKDVPIPPPVIRSRKHKYPFATMAVGEMFFVPGMSTSTFSTYASLWGRKLERKFKTRQIYADAKGALCAETDKGAVLGTGCWRTE